MLKGIDISNWQGVIDWPKVKASGVEFVFIKASEGNSIVDPRHAENFKGAKSVGIPTGWYHFGHPNEDPVSNADFLIKTIESLGLGELPIILDIEVTDNSTHVDEWATAFLDRVSSVTKHKVGWYSGEWFASTYLKNTMQKYPFNWVAKYSNVAPGLKWLIWQDSQKGHIDGIQGNVDIDEGVESILSTAAEYVVFDVVVGNKVFPAFVSNGDTYVMWGALVTLNTPHTYKGHGVFDIGGKEVQGIVYKGDTYIPWSTLAPGVKATRVVWAFEV